MLELFRAVLAASAEWLGRLFALPPCGVCCECGAACDADQFTCVDCILDRAI